MVLQIDHERQNWARSCKIFFNESNFAIFQVCFSLSVGFLGCLIMLMTEKLYMPGSHSHTGLYMQTVQPILLFITSSVVSYSYLDFKFNV